MWPSECPTEKEAMANIEGSTTVILGHVEWVRGNAPRARGIAVRVIQSVVAEERKILNKSVLGRNADAAIYNQLVLLEDAFRLVLIENLTGDRRYHLPR